MFKLLHYISISSPKKIGIVYTVSIYDINTVGTVHKYKYIYETHKRINVCTRGMIITWSIVEVRTYKISLRFYFPVPYLWWHIVQD